MLVTPSTSPRVECIEEFSTELFSDTIVCGIIIVVLAIVLGRAVFGMYGEIGFFVNVHCVQANKKKRLVGDMSEGGGRFASLEE